MTCPSFLLWMDGSHLPIYIVPNSVLILTWDNWTNVELLLNRSDTLLTEVMERMLELIKKYWRLETVITRICLHLCNWFYLLIDWGFLKLEMREELQYGCPHYHLKSTVLTSTRGHSGIQSVFSMAWDLLNCERPVYVRNLSQLITLLSVLMVVSLYWDTMTCGIILLIFWRMFVPIPEMNPLYNHYQESLWITGLLYRWRCQIGCCRKRLQGIP